MRIISRALHRCADVRQGGSQLSSTPGQTGGIDLARFIAAWAIVGFHSFSSAANAEGRLAVLSFVQILLFAALPLFFALSGFLHGSSSRSESANWLARRVGLLYWLLGVWSVVYLMFGRLSRALSAQPIPSAIDIVVFGLAWSHLWFLPVLAGCVILTWMFRRMGSSSGIFLLTSASLAIGYVALTSVLGLNDRLLYRTPMFWWFYYVVGFLWAGAIKPRCLQQTRRWTRPAVSAIGVAAAAAYLFGGVSYPQSKILLYVSITLLASVAFEVAMSSRVSRGDVAGLASLSLPIYVSHPVWIAVLMRLLRQQGEVGFWLVFVWIGALMLSTGTAVVMTRVGWLRSLLTPQPLVTALRKRYQPPGHAPASERP